MPYGFRNSEIGIRKPGYRKYSWCGIFPLDHEGDGAVGSPHRRMVRCIKQPTNMNQTKKEELIGLISGYASKINGAVEQAKARWMDEREYEDWSGYDEFLRKSAETAGMVAVRTQKRPFGVVVKVPGVSICDVLVYCDARYTGWKAVAAKGGAL